MDSRIPRVGVGVVVMRGGNVLLGRRLGAHGAGTWALPGGHLEFGESIEDCARREVREETGLLIDGVEPAPYTSTVFQPENKHYVTLFVQTQSWSGKPLVLEPGKCESWHWCNWFALPQPLFAPLAALCAKGFVPHGCGVGQAVR